ncbi:MAG TPA: S9 family peptidase [Candidatus Angelobacter sp.]|nr:S9 family peptidase [Candidatus Angelobacter sp.]
MFLSKLRGWWLLILLTALSAAGQPTHPALKPEDIFQLQTASDPQISPDGQRIVYVRGFSDIMQDKRYSNLWIINADGANHRPLTSSLSSDSSPRWSPDGTRIAYISTEDGRPQIYVRWMDTGQTARITSLESAPSGLDWSPDGKQISFATFVPADPVRLAQMPKAPPGAKWAEPPVIYDKSIYRFNAAGYLKPGYTHIFVVSAEGGTPRQITSGNFHFGGPGIGGASPAAWAPDAKHVLISANRHDNYESNPADTEVYEFSLEDGSVRTLTDRRGPDDEPQVSPDGKHIAYTGYDDRFLGYQAARLYVMNRDGSGSHDLSAKLDRTVRAIRWAPDSSGVYFIFDDQGDTKIGFYSNSGQFKLIASHLPLNGSYSLARNGAIAYVHTLPDVPNAIAVVHPGRAEGQVLTDLNRDLLAQRTLGKVEEIWFDSSVDKRKIQGWIVTPPGFTPGKKYPLILEIHGGPFSNYGDRWDLEKQIYAAHGYVVVYINPRGSTSYGEDFGNLIHHAYPGDDFFDLNSAVDAAIAKGYVDPDNVFVTGGSGGGVLTCWMIGRSTRFRAAASLYPVIDWYSFALTADIPILVVKYWFPGLPWDYPEQYSKRSVISLIKNVKTPTLLMTGESDYRTPISQAEEYYEALKLQGVESLLMRVPEEPHGIAVRPSHHIAKLLSVLAWFDKHRSDAKSENPTMRAGGGGSE